MPSTCRERIAAIRWQLERILGEVTPLYAAASRDGNVRWDPLFGKSVGLADHVLWRGMQLIAFFLAGLLAVLLVYNAFHSG